MGRTCFVPNCNSGYRSNPDSSKVSFFRPPIDKIEQWTNAIPRKDRKLTQKDSVCEKHFQEVDIIRELKTEVYTISLAKPKLSKDAIPSIFPNCPKYLSKQIKKRRLIIKHDNVDAKKQKQEIQLQSCSYLSESSSTETTQTEIDEKLWFLELKNNHHLCLPPLWQITVIKDIITLFKLKVIENHNVVMEKKVVLKRDSVSCYVFEHLLKSNCLHQDTVHSLASLKELIVEFEQIKICPGGMNITSAPSNFSCRSYAKDMISNTWRHQMCTLIISANSKAETCNFCVKCRYAINMFKSRSKKTSAVSTKIFKQKKVLKNIKLREKRLKLKTVYILQELKEVKSKFKKLDDKKLLSNIEDLKLPSSQKMLIKECINTCKYNRKSSRRYTSDWLLLCLLLHIKSPKCYKFLRDNEIMPLPSVSTVRKYLSRVKLKCGLDEEFFGALKRKIKDKNSFQRQGVLIFDEMMVRQSVDVSVTNMKLVGLQDFGNEHPKTAKTADRLADHALVFMWSSLADDFSQPVAVYASKGSTNGTTLAKLTLEIIKKIEMAGAKVHGVICDGAATNRKMWTEFGVSGKLDNTVNKIIHPMDDSRHLFFFSDVPHLIKCLRNRFLKNKTFTTPEGTAFWGHYKKLYELDVGLPNNLRVCPRITSNHINPSNLLKMRVRLATQVFSNSTVAGLRYYQNVSDDLKNVEGTIKFTKRINDLFDVMNRRYFTEGIRKNSEDFNVLKNNIEFINAWEKMVEAGKITKDQFLTSSTAEGLRVSMLSTLELCSLLLNEEKFGFVLTNKMNQDPLEVRLPLRALQFLVAI